MGSDAELLKTTHDLARSLLAHPEEPDATQVIRLAKERFAAQLESMAVN